MLDVMFASSLFFLMFVTTWFSGFLRQNHDYLFAFGISLATLLLVMEAYTCICNCLSQRSLVLPRQYACCPFPGSGIVGKTEKFFGLMIPLLGYAIIVAVLAYGEYSHKTWNFADNSLQTQQMSDEAQYFF